MRWPLRPRAWGSVWAGLLLRRIEGKRRNPHKEILAATGLHLVIAESLLAVNRDRQAEWEILAALPAIEESPLATHWRSRVASIGWIAMVWASRKDAVPQ